MERQVGDRNVERMATLTQKLSFSTFFLALDMLSRLQYIAKSPQCGKRENREMFSLSPTAKSQLPTQGLEINIWREYLPNPE